MSDAASRCDSASRGGPASARLEEALERISSPHLEGTKVFTDLFVAQARCEAAASDHRARSGSSLGPLDGRLVSIKGSIDIAGYVTRAGTAILRNGSPAGQDAEVVQRLRAAGAIVVGRTQMTEFAFSAIGINVHEATPGNPCERSRAPGGSSSGAVVSVLDRMVDIAIGSDTGGSIRIPAALSGAVGFKPTSGRIPMHGVFPLSPSLDCVGLIATSVLDCQFADHILAHTSPVPAPSPEGGTFRLLIARGRLFDRCDGRLLDTFEEACSRLRAGGVEVVESSLEQTLDALAAIDALGTFPSVELGQTLERLGLTDFGAIDQKTRSRIEAGAGLSLSTYARMKQLRAEAISSFSTDLRSDNAVILPTVPIYAPLLRDVQSDNRFHEINSLLLRNPRIANLLDCPSISLPIASNGLPVGLMIIGRRGADGNLLQIAARLEQCLRRSLDS